MPLLNDLARILGKSPVRFMTLLALVALILYTAVYPPAGAGIMAAFVVIVAFNIIDKRGLAGLGLALPENFKKTVMWGVVWGIVFQCFDVLFITPGIEMLTQVDTDYSSFAAIEGHLGALTQWLVFVWFVGVVIEEVVFRRYLFEEISFHLKDASAVPFLAVFLSILIFGLAHWYQGVSGVISTAIMGGFMLALYLQSGRNLWIPMIAHGTVNSISFCFFYFGLYHVDDLIWGLSHIAER